MENNKAIVLYMPVIHKGYVELLCRCRNAVSTVFLLTPEFIKNLDEKKGGQLERDIRAIDIDAVVNFIHTFFPGFYVKTLHSIEDLENFSTVVLLDEDISDILKKKLEGKDIVTEKVFLRWEWKSVNTPKEVVGKFPTTEDQYDREMMAFALSISDKSSDVWRQVGAVVPLTKNGRLLEAFNEHKPDPQIPYVYGDQRLIMSPGEKPEVCGALHAEKSIIAQAAKEGLSLCGKSIYVTTFPCPDCARIIVETGFKKVFFMTGYSNMDAGEILLKNNIEIFQVV